MDEQRENDLVESYTDGKIYPVCIKCSAQISPQDSRGWEKLFDHDIWLCPNCIYQSQACKDFVEIELRDLKDLIEKRMEVVRWKSEADCPIDEIGQNGV